MRSYKVMCAQKPFEHLHNIKINEQINFLSLIIHGWSGCFDDSWVLVGRLSDLQMKYLNTAAKPKIFKLSLLPRSTTEALKGDKQSALNQPWVGLFILCTPSLSNLWWKRKNSPSVSAVIVTTQQSPLTFCCCRGPNCKALLTVMHML